MGVAKPVEHPGVVHQRPRAVAAREHDHVRLWVVLERGVDLDAEHPVVGADHTAVVADERDVDVGDPLQHLVRPDAVERGELRRRGG